MATSTVPIYDPQGTLRDVPFESLKDAVANGGIPAHPVQAPDGKTRMVPVTRLQEAAQNGGKILPLDDNQTHLPAAYGFTLKNLASNAWEGAKGVAQGAYSLGKDLVQNPNWVEGDDSTLSKFVFKPADAEAAKAKDLWNKGQYSEAIGHGVAAGVPLVGPAAAQLGEQAGSGDVGGALAKGAGQVATAAAIAKAPSLVKSAGSRALLLGRTPEEAYQSALKPSTILPEAQKNAIVQTGLEEKIPVSEKGLATLNELIGKVSDAMDTAIPKDTAATVNKFAVARRLSDLSGKFATQVNPEADLNAISESGNEFLRNQPGEIPATQAAAIKSGTYKQLGSKAYGELGSATIEAQKGLARGIKEELIQQFPELEQLGMRDKNLIGLQDELERAVNRIGNHQLIGMGSPVVMTAGKMLTGSGIVGGVAGVLKAVLDNPAVKSKLAIALNKSGVPSAQVTSRLNAYHGALFGASLPAPLESDESGDQTHGQ